MTELQLRLNKVSIDFTNVQENKKKLNILNEEISLYEEAKKLIDCCNEEQSVLSRYIADIETKLLQSVFGEHYEFKFIDHIVKGAIVGQKPVIYENGKEMRQGGGVRNVAAFGMRLCFLVLSPNLSQVLVLDEYMNNLTAQNYAKVIEFVEDYQRKENLQLIFISHINFDNKGKLICIEKRNGVSRAI